ncbi:MAG: outer membrane beta-barrel protein [Alphaproteobacteria bacterium]|nr:outer membrane beta-barrel protein [Alphaproteobacteria bacterium]
MKKIALVAVLATSAAMAAPFNGFSVGASAGANFNKLTSVVASNGNKYNKNHTSFVGSIFAGYTKSFNSMFAGLDLGLALESSSKQTFTEQGTEVKVTFKPGVAFSFSPRLGYKFNDTMGVYVKFGMSYAKNEAKVKQGNAAEQKGKKTEFLFTPALGLEKAFCNMSVRGEVGYAMGRKKAYIAGNDNKFQRKGFVANIAGVYNF